MKESKMATKTITPVLLNYGGAKKFVTEMTARELEITRQSILRRAKEKAFSKGLPIYYSRKGKLMAEYADGKVLVVRK